MQTKQMALTLKKIFDFCVNQCFFMSHPIKKDKNPKCPLDKWNSAKVE